MSNEFSVHTAEVKADPKRPYKAYIATALTAVGTFVTFWIADTDPFTMKEIGAAALAALAASGLAGGATFAIPNPVVATETTTTATIVDDGSPDPF